MNIWNYNNSIYEANVISNGWLSWVGQDDRF